MTRVRQWVLTLAVAAALVLSFSDAAFAKDPSDPGTGNRSWSYATAADPSDPGTGP